MSDTKGVRQVLEDYATHYERVCLMCGAVWLGLHCPHDGYQNPCPKCDTKPAPKTTLEEDTCNGVTDIDEVLPALQEIMLGMLPEEDDVKPGSAAKMKSGEFVYGHKAGWNAAIKLIEQNIRGGFNNG